MRVLLRVVLPLCLVFLRPAPGGAQRAGPTHAGAMVGAARRSTTPPLVEASSIRASIPASERPAPASAFFVRLVIGTLGAVAGGVGGAVVGGSTFGTSSGEDPGLREAIVGAAIGAALGAGTGAALPRGGNTCRFERRLGLGLAGAAAGALVGTLPGTRSSVVLLTVPLGGATGAAGALALAAC